MVRAPFIVFGYARHWAAVQQLSNKYGVSITLHQWLAELSAWSADRMIVMPHMVGFFLYVGNIFINDKIMDTMGKYH